MPLLKSCGDTVAPEENLGLASLRVTAEDSRHAPGDMHLRHFGYGDCLIDAVAGGGSDSAVGLRLLRRLPHTAARHLHTIAAAGSQPCSFRSIRWSKAKCTKTCFAGVPSQHRSSKELRRFTISTAGCGGPGRAQLCTGMQWLY